MGLKKLRNFSNGLTSQTTVQTAYQMTISRVKINCILLTTW